MPSSSKTLFRDEIQAIKPTLDHFFLTLQPYNIILPKG